MVSLLSLEEDSAKVTTCPLHGTLSSAQLQREFLNQEGNTMPILFHSATELVKLQEKISNHPKENELENVLIILLMGEMK